MSQDSSPRGVDCPTCGANRGRACARKYDPKMRGTEQMFCISRRDMHKVLVDREIHRFLYNEDKTDDERQ